uniref:CLN6 transmembrane ER protein b n=1 Tax=Neogobius melanostomus TaxID=47308 RepID=A0A8C6S5G4_9GOBI
KEGERERDCVGGGAERRLAAASESDQAQTRTRFDLDLWALFLLQAWLLHLGRPVVMWVVPMSWFPLNRPGPSEYLHLLHCLISPLLLIKFLERSPRTLPDFLVHLGVTAVAMGTTAHLVTDSVMLRLVHAGFELHLSVKENGLKKNLSAPMVDAIELLSYYDDTVGHVMWSVPFFLVLLFFFGSSFCYKRQQQTMPTAAWILMLPNALYLWLLVTEGQTVILFLFTCFAMVATVMRQRRRGMVADGNGLFMILSFSVALVLVVLWSACWWRDEVLRRKHRGLLFVPQPRTVFSLHIKKYMSW